MQTIEATYRIVTPMFIGGADQTPSDGIRPPSFKGALRFWWRALNWGRFRKAAANDAQALQALHDEEVRLFGGSAEQGGQGVFLCSIKRSMFSHAEKDSVHKDFSKSDGSRYLAYGLMDAFSSRKTGRSAGQLTRGCINEGQDFVVRLVFRGRADESILQALIALGLLGGFGSRSRKGLGSVALQEIRDTSNPEAQKILHSAPMSIEDYEQAIINCMPEHGMNDSRPPFSALSSLSQISLLFREKDSAMDVLNQYGKAMMFYRSWGKDGQVLGKPSERNFKDDHDWSKGSMPKEFHPRRVVFGLPHNYGKGEHLSVEPEHHKRRASPLFYHVHQIGGQFVGVSILLPSDFLPKGERIKAGKVHVDACVEWQVLEQFLTGMDKSGSRRFPDRRMLTGGMK